MGGPAPRPLSPAELALLEVVARRKLPGTLRRTPERDRLRRVGYIAAYVEDFREGQDTLWLLTGAGEQFLAGRRAAA